MKLIVLLYSVSQYHGSIEIERWRSSYRIWWLICFNFSQCHTCYLITARRYASAVYAMALCLSSVCHKSVFVSYEVFAGPSPDPFSGRWCHRLSRHGWITVMDHSSASHCTSSSDYICDELCCPAGVLLVEVQPHHPVPSSAALAQSTGADWLQARRSRLQLQVLIFML